LPLGSHAYRRAFTAFVIVDHNPPRRLPTVNAERNSREGPKPKTRASLAVWSLRR
jgi:hypothetical protein